MDIATHLPSTQHRDSTNQHPSPPNPAMPIAHILILGAGPAGLATALALARLPASVSTSSPPLRITVLECRAARDPQQHQDNLSSNSNPPSDPHVSTPGGLDLGGTVNLTPLALRYLDRLGGRGRRAGAWRAPCAASTWSACVRAPCWAGCGAAWTPCGEAGAGTWWPRCWSRVAVRG